MFSTGWGMECDEGYVWVDSYLDSGCYNQEHITLFQDIINENLSTINMEMDCNEDGIIEPLELGIDCNTNINYNWGFGFGWGGGNLYDINLSSTGLSYIPDYLCELLESNFFGTISLDNNFLCPPYISSCIFYYDNYNWEYYIDLGFQDCQDCSSFGDDYSYVNHSDIEDINYNNSDLNWYFDITTNSNCFNQNNLNVLEDIISLNPNIHVITILMVQIHLVILLFYQILCQPYTH